MKTIQKLKTAIAVQTMLIGLLIASLAYVVAQSTTTYTISQGIYPGAPSYTIWREGSTYYAKDAYGFIPSWGSGTNKTTIIENVINALTNGGTILLKEITKPYLTSIPSNVLIIEQYQGEIHYFPREYYAKYYDGYKALTIAQHRALFDHDKIIFPYQASDNNIRVQVFSYRNLSEIQNYLVGSDPLYNDAHGTPAIAKIGTRYVLAYGHHSFTGTFTIAHSTDLSSWTTYTFPLSGDFSYPQLFVFNSQLYLFVRHSVSNTQTIWRLYTTTDVTNSGSWSAVTTNLINNGDGYAPYATIRLRNDSSRVFILWGSLVYGTPSYQANETMFIYSDDLSTWKNCNGTSITLPSTMSNSLLYRHTDRVHYLGRADMIGDTIYAWIKESNIYTGTSNISYLIKKPLTGSRTIYTFPTWVFRAELFGQNDGTVKIFAMVPEGHTGKGWMMNVQIFNGTTSTGSWNIVHNFPLTRPFGERATFEVYGNRNMVIVGWMIRAGVSGDETIWATNEHTIYILEYDQKRIYP